MVSGTSLITRLEINSSKRESAKIPEFSESELNNREFVKALFTVEMWRITKASFGGWGPFSY